MSKLFWNREGRSILAALLPDGSVIIGNSTEVTWRNWNAALDRLGVTYDNPLQEFHDASCRALPEERRSDCCTYLESAGEVPAVLKRRRLVTLADIIRFLKTMVGWAKAGKCVPQEEADRRACICATCPRNSVTSLGGCAGCTSIAADLFAIIGNRTTKAGDQLHACEVCACENKAQVWVPLEVLKQNGLPDSEYPDWCWKREQS